MKFCFVFDKELATCSGSMIGHPSLSLSWDEGEAEAEVIVTITGAVVVPVRRTAVLRIVVPTAATVHAVRAIGSSTIKKFLSESV